MRITGVKMVLSNEVYKKAHDVIKQAAEAGRHMLFEHEVYALLNIVGCETPIFCFIREEAEITEKMLETFGREVVIKVVSKDIVHKNKIGGVKRVLAHDALFVRYVVHSMRSAVLEYFAPDKTPEIEGFLLVEAVDFRESLGYEIMMGVNDDRDFGPVMTLSKGGDDAEFFAKYYDPPNLFLPYLTEEESKAIAKSINIRHKFEEIGHPEYMTMMADTMTNLSRLAYAFSPLSERRPTYHIKTIDVNPFVITKDHRMVAVDGYAEFSPAEETEIRCCITDGLESVFRPKGIAVVGVSTEQDKSSLAREILGQLMDFGRDDIYCINPKGGTTMMDGHMVKLYPSLNDIPCDVALAVYAAPAKYIPAFFAAMNKHRPKAVVLIPGIPAGVDYLDFTRQLDAVVPKGMRVVGPNCMGVFCAPDATHPGVSTLFLDEDRFKLEYGELSNVAMLSQSGAMAVTLADHFGRAPLLKAICSFGNKYDVKLTDLVAYFDRMDGVDVIAMYLEGFDPLEGRMFYELARETKKPLILYKGGRTEEGAKAALSHTAAMTGHYDVLEAACAQSGVVLMDDIETFGDVVKGFSLMSKKTFMGARVAAVTNAGFEATIFSDEIGKMTIAEISGETKARLNAANRHGLASASGAIIDTTPMTDDVMYGEFVEALLMDDGVDCVMVSAVPHVNSLKAAPENCHDADSLANILCRLYKKYDKPMAVSINAGDYYDEFVNIMASEGIPVYNNVKTAARVLDVVTGWYMNKARRGMTNDRR